MAYTPAPETQTYSTHRLPGYADVSMIPHQNSAISFMQNLVAVKGTSLKENEKEVYGESRMPIRGVQVDTTTSSNIARGCYVWEKTAGTVYYFAVFGTKVYTSTTGAYGSWTNVTTLTTAAATPVGFTEFINSATNTKSLVLVDGVQGFVFTSNAAGTEIVDADFPTPHLPFPVFIDGYLFLAKANTGDIYNSNLNSATAWTAGDFISSELYPDDLTALAKIDNYLLAIGKLGCEYFYDAANPTGTPLARYEGASLPFGCPVPYSVAFNKNTVIMLSNTSDGQYSLRLIEGFKSKDITPDWLADFINRAINGGIYLATGIRAYFSKQGKQLCYIFTMNNITGTTLTTQGFAFTYSLDTECWSSLFVGSGNASGGGGNWPICGTFGSSLSTATYVQGNSPIGTTGRPYFGLFASLSSSTYDDLDYGNSSSFQNNISVVLTTPAYDFGTLNRKFMYRLGVAVELGSPTVSSETLTIKYSNLFTSTPSGSYTTADQTIPLFPDNSPTTVQFPFITQLGSFRSRSIQILYTGQSTIRFKYIEVDINKGQQ